MLRANAWHHRSDSVSSVVVLIGVGGTMAGLPYLDAVAAVLVGVMIAHIAWELGAPALNELSDAGLEEERVRKIRQIINSVSGVESIHMLRTRRTGASATMDVHVLVAPWISVSEGHMIGQEVTDRLLKGMDELNDVTVHIDPEDDEIGVPCSGLPLRDEATGMLDELLGDIPGYPGYRRILLHYLDGGIEADIQYPVTGMIDEASVRRLREEIRERVKRRPEFRRVSVSYH
jgi:divalent metal cation (Fe/Co/Zn/Cd) transporter